MFKKLTLAAAAGAGYVLGAKAGKERYTQIEAKFREIAGMPAVQSATTAVKENAQPLLDSAKDTVNEKVSSAKGDKSSDVVDLGASGAGAATRPPVSTTPRPATTTTGAAGAAPSVTAPVKRP
jgi:hypothetical protein